MNLCPALVELKIKDRECAGRKAAAVYGLRADSNNTPAALLVYLRDSSALNPGQVTPEGMLDSVE